MILRMINPIEISVEPMVDVVAVSGEIISDIVGEQYFGRYFSKPMVWTDEYSSSRRYEVEYDYSGVSEGWYSGAILTFNEDKMLVDQEGIPDSGSCLPYRVSEDEARLIALENGFPGDMNSSVFVARYTSPDEWESMGDKVSLETYYNQDYSDRVVNLTHYMWRVRHLSSEKGANPTVYQLAIVDVGTGELYSMDESKRYTVGSIFTNP